MPVPPPDELAMEPKHLVLKTPLEYLDIRSLPLPTAKLPPSRKEILW